MQELNVKTCIFCKKDFLTKRKDQRFCSSACSNKSPEKIRVFKNTVQKKYPKITCVCSFCKKEFIRKNGTIGKFCSKLCYNKSKKGIQPKSFDRTGHNVHYIGKCPTCGNPTINQKYCSKNCFLKRPSKSFPSTICGYCGVEFIPRHKNQKFCSKKCCGRNVNKIALTLPISMETRKKRSDKLRGRARPLDVKERISAKLMGHKCFNLNKVSDSTKEKIRLARLKQIIPFKDTSIEKIVQKELTKRNMPFRKHFAIYPYQVDILLENFNLIIEADGCYWHGCPLHFPSSLRGKKDKVATAFLESKGYTVFRIWEHDIRNKEILQERLTEILSMFPITAR